MLQSLSISVLLTTVLISSTLGANILGIFTALSPSHLIIEISMAKVLAEKGHNVTVVTSLKPHTTHKNLNIIRIELSENEQKSYSDIIWELSQKKDEHLLLSILRHPKQILLNLDRHRVVMEDQRIKDLYENKDNKFDLVFLGYFLNSFQMGIAQKLKVPVVLASSMPQWEYFQSMLGTPNEISYVPGFGRIVEKGSTMTTLQRFLNLFSFGIKHIFIFWIERTNEKIYKELYGDDPNMPPYENLNKNVSLVFFNTHGISENPIRPTVPGAIEVGGIQVKEKPDPLPHDLERFLNSSDNGAILLSLGTNVQSSFINPSTVQKMFNVLSKLKQNVIWKWEDLENTPGKSDNILYSKWVPQDDLLAHPKVILFINHAGRGGITESQYHGKPMLSLPVFGDQPANARKMVFDGYGLSMSLLTLEEEPFKSNVMEIIQNPNYTEKVKAFSVLFRDRPLSARESVLYWTEYVLRHRGAPHLQSHVVRMGFVEANNLDIYAIILVSLFFNLIIVKLIAVRIWRIFFSCQSTCVKKIDKQKLQ